MATRLGTRWYNAYFTETCFDKAITIFDRTLGSTATWGASLAPPTRQWWLQRTASYRAAAAAARLVLEHKALKAKGTLRVRLRVAMAAVYDEEVAAQSTALQDRRTAALEERWGPMHARVYNVEVTGWEDVMHEGMRIANEFAEECEDGDARKVAGAEYELVLGRFMLLVARTVASAATGRYANLKLTAANAMAAASYYAGLFALPLF